MNALFVRGALLAAVVILQGCSTYTHPIPAPETKSAVAMPIKPLVKHLVFFEFDNSELSKDIITLIAPHVRYLVQQPNQTLLIEGHADESGDKEYNHALGLSRAKSVRDAFIKQGIDESKIITRSQGENNPLNTYHHARNRRVQLVY